MTFTAAMKTKIAGNRAPTFSELVFWFSGNWTMQRKSAIMVTKLGFVNFRVIQDSLSAVRGGVMSPN